MVGDAVGIASPWVFSGLSIESQVRLAIENLESKRPVVAQMEKFGLLKTSHIPSLFVSAPEW